MHALSSGPTGSPGTYQATFVLAVPGINVVQTEVNFGEVLNQGDSLFEVPPGVAELRVDLLSDDRGIIPTRMVVGINTDHRLQFVRVNVQADGFQSAGRESHDLVMPSLSRWAFQHDTPLTVSAVELLEISTEVRRWTMCILGTVKTFGDQGGASSPDGRKLLSAYREGLNSHEPLYQALSMFRVVEGSYALRARRRAESVAATGSFFDPGEKIPGDVTVIATERRDPEESWHPYRDKKFTAVRDELKSKVRHVIAHLDPTSDPLDADSMDAVESAQLALPVLRYMARVLLEAELSMST